MQRELIVKGKSLGGRSDLTLLANIKPGFIDSLETVTYKTRIKRVLESLHGVRVASHEYSLARLLSDSVERVGVIHSVRVAVLEPQDQVLLAVTFDGSWESYIRVLWDKVGTLLDLIFCGTHDYVTAWGHTFDEWLVWARRVQVETGFFYAGPEASARDVLYSRRIERMRMRRGAEQQAAVEGQLDELRAVLPLAEEATRRLIEPRLDLADEPPLEPLTAPRSIRERMRVGLQGLALLYRLTDLHRPGTEEGEVLRRAAIDLLLEFVTLRDDGALKVELPPVRARFARQLDWLFPTDKPVALKRQLPRPPDAQPPLGELDRRDIQGGILRSYEKVTHGVVLMLEFRRRAAAAQFFSWLLADKTFRLTSDFDKHDATALPLLVNLGLTPAGLRAAGIGEETLELFPEAFRQGMAARAGLLGDVRHNHPQRWRLPQRHQRGATDQAVVDPDAVHAYLYWRCASSESGATDPTDPKHPLNKRVDDFVKRFPDIRLVAVQPLVRYYRKNPQGQDTIVEHFGYLDGNGQPDVEPPSLPVRRNRVHLGEFILGHDNTVDPAIDPLGSRTTEADRERLRWQRNGSFLVVRKYRQFVGRLRSGVAATTAKIVAADPQADPAETTQLVYAKLMGRRQDSEPLVPYPKKGSNNNFLYDDDPQAQQCPLHAHIRLANPRSRREGAERPARLLRRSMSYGPPVADGTPSDDIDKIDRGLVFMAFNASLSEQYEVVQRWLSGGNSTGSSSGQGCPFVGVPESGVSRHFPFEYLDSADKPAVAHVQLEPAQPLFDEPEPFTQLEWGVYLFTPSITAVRKLAATAASLQLPVPWSLARGRELLVGLQRLQHTQGDEAAIEAWKLALEDPESIDRLDSAALWDAIRQDHGGLLKTPYGVLVASRDLLHQVLLDPQQRYSVCGQLARQKRSFGEIFLGLDAGPDYKQQAAPVIAAIEALGKTPKGRAEVFELAFHAATRKLDAIVKEAKCQAQKASDGRFDVTFDAREIVDEVLADLSDAWFGLSDDDPKSPKFRRGSSDWAWQPGLPPPYPGHYTALSRYMFQPHPGRTVIELGEAYGQALREAMNAFVIHHRAQGTLPKARVPVGDGADLPSGAGSCTPVENVSYRELGNAPVAEAVFKHPQHGADHDFVARTMVGVLMGFTPTIVGAVLNVLREWHRDNSFSAVRGALAGRTDLASAEQVLIPHVLSATRMRPMPQIIWRTARHAHRLGPDGPDALDIEAGDRLVLGLVSGTQESLANGGDDGRLMFGGVREQKPAAPTHACPGYHAGIASMLGTLAALLTRKEMMRPALVAASFRLEGPVEIKPIEKQPGDERRDFVKSAAQGIPIFACGDSWLDARYKKLSLKDLRYWLRNRYGHTFVHDDKLCSFEKWGRIATVASKKEKLCELLTEAMGSVNPPQLILLSGGGQDTTGGDLEALLNPSGSAQALNDHAVESHIDRLFASYVEVIEAIDDTLKGQTIPILVHGYDHPVPDWRLLSLYDADYLKTPFKNRGYAIDGKPNGVPATAMAQLIDLLNDMLEKRLVAKYPAFVHHVNLTNTLKADQWWDDLHPTNGGFEVLTTKVQDKIAGILSSAASASSSALS